MGSAAETGSIASDRLTGVASGAGEVASSVSGRVAATPDLARRQAQGNPLAAGLIAFGIGWLDRVDAAGHRDREADSRPAQGPGVLRSAEPVKEQLGEARPRGLPATSSRPCRTP